MDDEFGEYWRWLGGYSTPEKHRQGLSLTPREKASRRQKNKRARIARRKNR